MKRFLPLVLLIVSACQTPHFEQSQANGFLDLFSRAESAERGGFLHVSDVQDYVRSCCSTREQALDLLDSSGFEIFMNNRQDNPEFFKKHEKALDIQDNDAEVIYGKKEFSFLRVFPKTYRVRLYLDELGNVSRAKASVHYAPAP